VTGRCPKEPAQIVANIRKRLWRFGAPLIITGLLSAVMHQGNRYFLRVFVDLDQVGLFSLAYMLGQGVNSLLLMPFKMIWGVVIYEIADQPDAKLIYVRVFEYFMYGVALVLFGVSLFAKPLLQLMVAPDYLSAYLLVPIICLAFFFFSLHEHFRVPALLAKRTVLMIPVTVAAVMANLVANLVLIPLFGAIGAACASVITFIVYSFGGLWCYRRIERYNYPFMRIGLVVIGLITSYMAYWGVEQFLDRPTWLFGAGVIIWSAWAIGLLGRLLRDMFGVGGLKGLRELVFRMSTAY